MNSTMKHQSPFTGNKTTDFNKFAELDVQRSVAFNMIKKEGDTTKLIPVHGLTARDITTVRTDIESVYKDCEETFLSFCSKNGLSIYERTIKCVTNGTFLTAVQQCVYESKNPKQKLDLGAYDQALNSFASVCNKLQEKKATPITLSEVHGFLKIFGIVTALTVKPENLKGSINQNPDINCLLKTDNENIKEAVRSFLTDPLKGTRELKTLIEN